MLLLQLMQMMDEKLLLLMQQQKKKKQQRMFLQILEGIHPKDAEVLIAMKDKKFENRYDGITKALVQEVWPNLIRK